jgi:NAD(P)H-dependent FMN reductase
MSLKIAVITSTTRPSRMGPVFAKWFMDQVKDYPEVSFELIDLAEENLPFLEEEHSPASGMYEKERTKAWSKKIASYDGYVFVTAEYNNGYPAPLKNAIDTLYHEWARKPVAFFGYGTYGAARSIEQLVNVTAKLNMVPLPANVVAVIEPWSAIKEDGSLRAENVKGKLDGLVENLTWWAKLLAQARSTDK